jgi:hypothetical protein
MNDPSAADPVIMEALRSKAGGRESGDQGGFRKIVVEGFNPRLAEELAIPPPNVIPLTENRHRESELDQLDDDFVHVCGQVGIMGIMVNPSGD